VRKDRPPPIKDKEQSGNTTNMNDEHIQDLNLACWKQDGKLICTQLKNDLFVKIVLPFAQWVGERFCVGSYDFFTNIYADIFRLISTTEAKCWRECRMHTSDGSIDFKLCFKTIASAWATHCLMCPEDLHMLARNEMKLTLAQQLESPPPQLDLAPAIRLERTEPLFSPEPPPPPVTSPVEAQTNEERRKTPTPPPPAASPVPCSSKQADENDQLLAAAAALGETTQQKFPPKERLKRGLEHHHHQQASIELIIKTDDSAACSSTSVALDSEVRHEQTLPASPQKRPMLLRQRAVCTDDSYIATSGKSRTRLQIKRETEEEGPAARNLEVQVVDLTKDEEEEDRSKSVRERELMHDADSISTGGRQMETEVSYKNARIIRKKEEETDCDDIYGNIDHSDAPGFFSSKWEDPVFRAGRGGRRGRGRGRGRGGRGKGRGRGKKSLN
jgi:hypothetical protein